MSSLYQFDPATENYNFYQGSTFKRKVSMSVVPASTGIEEPWPFENDSGVREWYIRAQVRETKDSETCLADLTEDNGGIVVYYDDDTSYFYITIDSETSASFPGDSTVYYDVELFKDDGPPQTVLRWMEGTMTVSAEVTRSCS